MGSCTWKCLGLRGYCNCSLLESALTMNALQPVLIFSLLA